MVSSLEDTTRRALAEVLDVDGVELAADLFADDLGAREDGHVLEHLLAPVAESGCLDGEDVQRAPKLVDHEGCEGLALNVLAYEDEVLADLEDLLKGRKELLDRGELLVRDEDVRIVDLGDHPLLIGDEVGGDVAAVDLHTLDELLLVADALRLFYGNHAVLADLLHHVGDEAAHLVVVGGQGSDLGDLLLALDGVRHV